MWVELDDEQTDAVVVHSLSNWMIELLDDEDTPERWDTIANLYCALQYYITPEHLDALIEEYPEFAEMFDEGMNNV